LGRIRKWRLKEYNKWDVDLPSSILACNTRQISTTGFSAMESLMGFTAGTMAGRKLLKMTKKELKEKMALVTEGVTTQAIGMRLRVLESLREESIRFKDVTSRKMKERYDKKVHDVPLEVGQQVLIFDSSLLKQWSRKLEERWLGPYVITWKGTMGAYAIDVDGKTRTVSGDQLKLYHLRG
jgi:hypothetical protein